MIEFQLLAGLRGVEKSIPNDNNLFPFTFDVGVWVGMFRTERSSFDRLMACPRHAYFDKTTTRPGKHRRVRNRHIGSSIPIRVPSTFVFARISHRYYKTQ